MKSLLVSLMFLTACATDVKNIKGPDGTPHKLLGCYDIEDCYKNASKLCGKYKIINTSNETTPASGGTSNTYTKLLIKCEGK